MQWRDPLQRDRPHPFTILAGETPPKKKKKRVIQLATAQAQEKGCQKAQSQRAAHTAAL